MNFKRVDISLSSSASNRIIGAKDHASIQINFAEVVFYFQNLAINCSENFCPRVMAHFMALDFFVLQVAYWNSFFFKFVYKGGKMLQIW